MIYEDMDEYDKEFLTEEQFDLCWKRALEKCRDRMDEDDEESDDWVQEYCEEACHMRAQENRNDANHYEEAN